MDKIKVMIAGLGDMGKRVAKRVLEHPDMELCSFALSGPNSQGKTVKIDGYDVYLFSPDAHEKAIEIKSPDVIVVYTTPTVVNRNVELYAKLGIPCVVGTTGGDYKKMESVIKASNISALISPNMCGVVVVLTDGLEYLGNNHEGSLASFTGEVEESHQLFKKDPSGTYMSSWKPSLEKTGVKLKELRSKRRRVEGHGYHYVDLYGSIEESKIPLEIIFDKMLGEYLSHEFVGSLRNSNAWIEYTEQLEDLSQYLFTAFSDGFIAKTTKSLISQEKSKGFSILNIDIESVGNTVRLKFYYNSKDGIGVRTGFSTEIDGRETYAEGTVSEAIPFVMRKIREGSKGQVYSMIDALRKLS